MQDPEADEATEIEEVVVTGSRIARQDYVANSPIVTVGQEQFQDTGSVTIDTLINDLPQFVPSVNMTSNNPSNGGQANIDLRGLGSARNLVLLDGRRLVPSDSTGAVDVNVIPTALIRSIEVISGGASATYGSDALGGVTNFLLKRDFTGVQFDGQYGQTDRDDGRTDSVALTIGGDFAEDRGNAVVSLGYSNRAEIFNAARDFAAISGPSGTSPLGSTIFDGTNLPSQAAATAVLAGSRPSDTFGFNNDASVFAYRGRLGFVSPGGIDYDGFAQPGPTQNPDFAYNTGALNYLVLPQTRYNVYGQADYTINEQAEVYASALFTQYETSQVLAPTPAAGTTGFRVLPTNPFIPGELRTLLNSRPNPAATFRLDKRFNVVGPREAANNYDVYQVTTGARGELVDTRNWTYDIYATYGRVDQVTTQSGNISRSAVQRLLDAADGGAALCAGGFNPFGDNPVSAACSTFVSRTSKNTTTSTQRVVEGTLQGDLFDLPAGALQFAVGADYRENTFNFIPDALLTTGDVAGFNAVGPLAGSVKVQEVFGELFVPVLADLPFVRSLNLSFAYRYSDYSTVDGVTSYKADGDWEVFDGFRFRGGYQRAVRAPSIGELFQPQNLNFPNVGLAVSSGGTPQFAGDPCDVRGAYRAAGAANAAQVRALCLTQGVPTQIIDTYTFTNQQVTGLSGGNPDLEEETADTFSVGAVWSPRFGQPWLQRLSGSVDYYNIEITEAIGFVTASEQLRRCFNFDGTSNPTFDPNNFFCNQFERDRNSGQVINAKETNGNLGTLRTSGVDLQIDWGVDFGDVGLPLPGVVNLNLITSWLEIFERQDFPGGPFVERTGTVANGLGQNFPEWKSLLSLDYTIGDVRLGGRWRYINGVENFNNRTQEIDAFNYFDINASWELREGITVRGGINNVGDEAPPVYSSAVQANTDPSTYDVLGRRYYVGLTAKF